MFVLKKNPLIKGGKIYEGMKKETWVQLYASTVEFEIKMLLPGREN